MLYIQSGPIPLNFLLNLLAVSQDGVWALMSFTLGPQIPLILYGFRIILTYQINQIILNFDHPGDINIHIHGENTN